ncbi:MAG: FAD-dependent oxidoreductase [Oscillospiraceae bacterium]|jgi:2,4-dienoyl-CoA reductase-like NADH-dependent reductase (Old Yellow Enzyme family)/NADPH-dependent 2,4-dienoyl-CoA reductase/sulfur reductase-like enzyme|nr:FAD-dependent oxidoreductase [Oscillospiraceae bacterium]
MASQYKHVFNPIKIRGIDFKNRIVLAPPSPNLCSTEGMITREFVDWMEMFARGGVTTLYVGNASIDITECKDEDRQLNMANPAGIIPLSWYAEMCASYNCHASLEINHNGKDTAFETVGHAPYSASAIITSSEITRAKRLGREPVRSIEMTKEKIKETVDKYANAAAMMKEAGMDIVLVHGGHGNLISQFTSPMYNFRTDEYGGSTEKRARFAVEVCKEIRARCGEDFVIEYRISADEIAPEGMHFPETLELIGYLEPYIDIIHVSAGIHSDFDMKYYRNWCQNYMMPHMYNVHFAKAVKEKFPNLLVTAVGSITSIAEAEEIISNGWADFVAMCRPLMADPDQPRKFSENRPEDHRPCLRCDQCARFFPPRSINCAINPLSGLTSELKDGTVPEAKFKKKVGIVGGGPAGVYAFMAAVERGHDVTLYEKDSVLGGNLIGAAAPPDKTDLKKYLKWFQREAAKYPVNYANTAHIKTNTAATPELLEQEKFDALIIAVGAEPVIPRIPGVDKKHVSWTSDAELGKTFVGDDIVIVGAGSIGIEAALDFAEQGKKVKIVELMPEGPAHFNLFRGGGHAADEMLVKLEELKIPVYYETSLTEITDDKAICKDAKTGETLELSADTVLISIGMRARTELADSLRHSAPEGSVYIVGDAITAGKITNATNGGFQIGLRL